jgi:DNA (cytosine-5)-methyltransferase 1
MSRVHEKGHGFGLARLSWDKPSRTAIKQVGGIKSDFGSGLIHPTEHRHLTIPELKRISSFPDDFEFVGSFKDQWARMGNCVPPLLVKAIAEHIKKTVLQA